MQKSPNVKSIQTRIFRAVLYPIIILALVMSLGSIIIVNHQAKEAASNFMTSVSERESLRIDNRLNLVSHSVSVIYEYIDELNNNGSTELFSGEYGEQICTFALAIANQTEGAAAVYYRYNPDLSGLGTGGFFWSRQSGSAEFSEEPPTDLLKYDPSDIEHVGWYYIPGENGTAMWMEPYFNRNLGMLMISYVVPVFSSQNDFLGVVGMDIDFGHIMEFESDIKLYNTGKIALVDLSERLLYTVGEDDNVYSKALPEKMYDYITTVDKASDLLEIKEPDGSKSVIYCRKLVNGMIIYITVPQQEIFQNRTVLVLFVVILTAVVLAAAIFEVRKHTAHIVKPINRLAEVTDCYARGEWSDSYICNTGDELQVLSESIGTMANNTQVVLSALNSLARTDSMTGLRNKTSYLEFIDDIQRNRHENYNNYAVAVMDMNFLKKANDQYGHEAGDALLKEAGKYISTVFAHSAVFRIGGDEFAAILTDEDYMNREALLNAFEEGLENDRKGPMELKLSIAIGMASYPAEADGFDELFRLADGRMYEKKKAFGMRRES